MMIPLALALVLASAETSPTTTTTTTPTAATAKLLVLRELFAQLACEKVIEAAPAIEDHRLATLDERLEASFRHAYCLVVIGNLSDASALFAAIVQEKIDANPPFDFEPRVQILLEAARSEELQRQSAAAVERHRRLMERVTLNVRPPVNVTGGNRAIFYVDVTDPDALVTSLRVDFRKQPTPAPAMGRGSRPDGVAVAAGAAGGEFSDLRPGGPLAGHAGDAEFYALPIVKQSDGRWRGEIPGTYTRSTTGQVLEWFITASDAQGDALKSEGTRAAPRVLEVAPGSAMALDLKANERLTQETRLVFALVVQPLFSEAMAFAATMVASLVGAAVPGLGVATFALLPIALAGVGDCVVASTVLDGWVGVLAPLGVGLAFGLAYVGAVFWIGEPVNSVVPGAFAKEVLDGRLPYLVTVSAAGLATLASAATTAVLVVMDPPAE